jgi:hypothetical protein
VQPAEPAGELHDEVLCACAPPPRLASTLTYGRSVDLYHAMTWPSLSYVAEDEAGRIVGYILAKMCVASTPAARVAYEL